jgi:multidrug resistance efflux pump
MLFSLLLLPFMLLPVGVVTDDGGIQIDDCTVQFIAEVNVPALDAGKLVEILGQNYQSVSRGQLLGRLDDKVLLDQQRTAEIRRQLLTNRLNSDLAQQIADAAYKDARVRYDSNMNTNASSPGSVPSMELNRSLVALQRAELESKRIVEQKEELRLELNIQAAEVAAIDHQLAQLNVFSPVDGVLLSIQRREGEWVSRGETVFRVARMDRLQIPVLLREDQLLQRRAAGASCIVQWLENGVTHSLRGKIEAVDPQLYKRVEYRALVEVENRRLANGWLLAPGRRVTVKIYPADADPSLPDDARATPATARLLRSGESSTRGPVNR